MKCRVVGQIVSDEVESGRQFPRQYKECVKHFPALDGS